MIKVYRNKSNLTGRRVKVDNIEFALRTFVKTLKMNPIPAIRAKTATNLYESRSNL